MQMVLAKLPDYLIPLLMLIACLTFLIWTEVVKPKVDKLIDRFLESDKKQQPIRDKEKREKEELEALRRRAEIKRLKKELGEDDEDLSIPKSLSESKIVDP